MTASRYFANPSNYSLGFTGGTGIILDSFRLAGITVILLAGYNNQDLLPTQSVFGLVGSSENTCLGVCTCIFRFPHNWVWRSISSDRR